MLLNHPLEVLLPPDRAEVLTVLARAGQPLSGRTIAKLTDTVSQPTTARLLSRFVRNGLVHKVPGGYVLNRDHLAYGAIAALLEAQADFTARVAHAVAGWTHPPITVALFGSAARGTAGQDSDLDLLLVRPTEISSDDATWALDVAALSEQVQGWVGMPCEVLEYSTTELAELVAAEDPLVESLRRDAVTLTGRQVREVLAS
jgi:predicted nucleotidyltransferase